MVTKIILFFFLCCLSFFGYQSYDQISRNLEEREYYKNLFESYIKKDTSNSEDKDLGKIKVISQGGLTLTVSKIKNSIQDVQVQETLLEHQEKQQKILDLTKSQVDYTDSIIYIPGYIEKKRGIHVIFSQNDTTIYSDLKKGVRVSPESQKPNELGITFIEGHSGQNYRNSLSYSFFDSLSLYYDSVPYDLPIYIETKDYIFEYTLFKKEIINPGEKEFYQSDFHHLILMTCYPRNTSQKRALFHGRLVSTVKKS